MQHLYTKYHEARSTMIHTHSMSNEVSMTFLRCNVFLEAYINNIHIPSLQVRNHNPFVLEALLIEDYRVNFCSGMRGIRKPCVFASRWNRQFQIFIMKMFCGGWWLGVQSDILVLQAWRNNKQTGRILPKDYKFAGPTILQGNFPKGLHSIGLPRPWMHCCLNT